MNGSDDVLVELVHTDLLPWHIRRILESTNAIAQIAARAADEIAQLRTTSMKTQRITLAEMSTMRPWELENELERCQNELLEARKLLLDTIEEYVQDAGGYTQEFLTQHANALAAIDYKQL